MTDTVTTAEDLVRRLAMQRTPAERLRMCARMFSTAKTLALAGILREHKDLTPLETRRQLLLRFYGNEFTGPQTEAILEAIKESG